MCEREKKTFFKFLFFFAKTVKKQLTKRFVFSIIIKLFDGRSGFSVETREISRGGAAR